MYLHFVHKVKLVMYDFTQPSLYLKKEGKHINIKSGC